MIKWELCPVLKDLMLLRWQSSLSWCTDSMYTPLNLKVSFADVGKQIPNPNGKASQVISRKKTKVERCLFSAFRCNWIEALSTWREANRREENNHTCSQLVVKKSPKTIHVQQLHFHQEQWCRAPASHCIDYLLTWSGHHTKHQNENSQSLRTRRNCHDTALENVFFIMTSQWKAILRKRR